MQRLVENGVDDRENRSVRPDAERKRQYGRDREAGSLP
jgi:hypothetical protein